MDLGLDFDDEDLEVQSKKKDKTGDLHLPYNVKICSSKWFETAYMRHSNGEIDNCELLQQMLKFDADLLYRERKYSSAAQRYERLLEILPSSNVSVRLDVKESLSRCCVYLGLEDKGLQLAHELADEISIEDDSRHRQSILLLSFIYEKLERWKECCSNLEKLCQLQPCFPQTWLKLGDVYSSLQSSESEMDVSAQYPVKQLTCFLRARSLLMSVMRNSNDFVKTRNQALIQELSEKIDLVPLSASEKMFAQQFMEKEIEVLSTENKGELPELNEKSNKHSLESFYSKFCSWHSHCKDNPR